VTLEPTTSHGPHGPRLRDESNDFGSPIGASATGAYLRQIAVQHAVLVEIAKRRLDHLPGLLETLERDVVLLTAGGREHRDALGAFTSGVWRHGRRRVHELFVNADRRLGHPGVRTAEGVLVTLLHEASHLYACIRGIRDTFHGGRFHNRRFGEIAGVLGLTVVQRPAVGLETPALATWAQNEYADLLAVLDRSLVLTREPVDPPVTSGDGTETAAGAANRYVFAACHCRTPARKNVTILVACDCWYPETIRCALCGANFVETRPTGLRKGGSRGQILAQEPPERRRDPARLPHVPLGQARLPRRKRSRRRAPSDPPPRRTGSEEGHHRVHRLSVP